MKYSKSLLILIFIFNLICNNLSAQKKQFTVSGYVKESVSGESLINANIYDNISQKGAISNNYGYYCLILNKKSADLEYSYSGYNKIKKKIILTKDTVIDIFLSQNNEIDEVLVLAEKNNFLMKKNNVGAYKINLTDIKSQPVLLGENDILKSIQLIPGIQAGKEGTAGLNVRGGSPDQNLILLDGVPVYNANHLFGFFSLFNTDALNSVNIYKDGIPARYGGRLSSVIDIYTKEGNSQKISVKSSIGLISSKLTVEGPLIKNKSSFMISGRRTYLDLLTRPFTNNSEDNSIGNYFFYDLCAKFNYTFSKKSKLFVSTYLGDDKNKNKKKKKYTYQNSISTSIHKDELSWGNRTAVIRWNYILFPKLFSNTTLTYSKYEYLNSNSSDMNEINSQSGEISNSRYMHKNTSGINDFACKYDLDYSINKHNFKVGAAYTYHIFTPGIEITKNLSEGFPEYNIDTTFGYKKILANEFNSYIEDNINLTKNLLINVGLHYSRFKVNNRTYASLEPRLIASLKIKNYTFQASYTQTSQNIHLLTNTSIGMPTDLWLPATESIKPQHAKQYNIGTSAIFNKTEFNISTYYKEMSNLIEYKEGAFYGLQNTDWQNLVESGKGKSYGVEFSMQKKINKLDLYFGYTLSKSTRQFNNISYGQEFPYRYDCRHNIVITSKYKIKPNIDLSLAWYFSTGNAITLSTQKTISNFLLSSEHYRSTNITIEGSNQELNNKIINFFTKYRPYTDLQIGYYEHRNNYRMPCYHRMDIAVNFYKQKKYFQRTFSIGIYNLYNRQNPFYYYLDTNKINPYQASVKLKQVTLFPIIPYITYSIKF